jgi:cob(I)alamin adenosyltransferase
MTIYTRQGDNGTTQLIGGQRVSKNNEQVNAYGDIDELNSFIGGILTHISEDSAIDAKILDELYHIQMDLFGLGSCLATSEHKNCSSPKHMVENRVESLEKSIDRMSCHLPPFKAFILPAGHASAVFSHMARTICRRAERKVVGLIDSNQLSEKCLEYRFVQQYLNRLSDYFFTLARYLNSCFHVEETIVDQKRYRY